LSLRDDQPGRVSSPPLLHFAPSLGSVRSARAVAHAKARALRVGPARHERRWIRCGHWGKV